jgi:mRNA interferase RelE/StbE
VSYSLRLSKTAEMYLNRLETTAQDRIERRLAQLMDDPFNVQHSKALVGAGAIRSARVGGWRILFTVDVEDRIVRVEKVAPRGQVYRSL